MRIEGDGSTWDFLSRPPSTGRALVPVRRDLVPLEQPPVSAQGALAGDPPSQQSLLKDLLRDPGIDIRNLSPRRMSAVSMDLYTSGALSWDEYSMLAFQPELHRDYDRTIGALIGETAQPDRPRDFVAHWEERLAFEQRYNGEDERTVERTRRIVGVLRDLSGAPPTVTV